MVAIEELHLRALYGDSYAGYARRVPRLAGRTTIDA